MKSIKADGSRGIGKFFLFAAFTGMMTFFSVNAAFAAEARGGFQGPGAESITVEQALGMRDDAKFCMKGRIVRNLGGELYEFTDGTGIITVEIDNDKWRGAVVGPQDTVLICGELDKDWATVEFEVDSLVKQ